MKSPITCITAAWMLIFFDEKSCEWPRECWPCKWCKWLTKLFRCWWWWFSCKSSLSLLVIGVCSELSRCTYICMGQISFEIEFGMTATSSSPSPALPLLFPRIQIVSFVQFTGKFSSQLCSSISTQSPVLCRSVDEVAFVVKVVSVVNVWLVRRIISLSFIMPLLNVYDRLIEFVRPRFWDRAEQTLSRCMSFVHVRFDLFRAIDGDAIEFHSFLAPCFSIGSSNSGRYSNLVLLLLWYVWSCFGECEWQLWRWCTFVKQHRPSPCRIKAILLQEIREKNVFYFDLNSFPSEIQFNWHEKLPQHLHDIYHNSDGRHNHHGVCIDIKILI